MALLLKDLCASPKTLESAEKISSSKKDFWQRKYFQGFRPEIRAVDKTPASFSPVLKAEIP